MKRGLALLAVLVASAALAQPDPLADYSEASDVIPSLAATARPEKPLRPDYPPAALEAEQQGRVLMSLRVLASGAVAEAQVRMSSGHEALDRAAMHYLLRAKFVPARDASGAPVASWVMVPIRFVLED